MAGQVPWQVVGAGPWHSESTGLSARLLVACGGWEEPAAGWARPSEGQRTWPGPGGEGLCSAETRPQVGCFVGRWPALLRRSRSPWRQV